MHRLVLYVLFVLVNVPAVAQEPDYFSDPALFREALAGLAAEIGDDANLLELRLRSLEINAQVQAPGAGPRVDAWRVERVEGLFSTYDDVSGPETVRQQGPVADVASGFFPLGTVPLDRLSEILSEAVARSFIADDGRVTEVRIARQIGLIPQPHYGEVRWQITVANERERAIAEAAADGAIIGVDISQTHRGRSRDFYEQDDWPLDEAQEGFARLVGTGDVVYAVTVRRSAISVEAVSEESQSHLTGLSWDGSRYTRRIIDIPNFQPALPSGDMPFAIDDIDFTLIPEILAKARAEAPDEGAIIESMKAARKPYTIGEPEVLWEVTLTGNDGRAIARSDNDTTVRLRPDATVVSVLLPEALRPAIDYVDGEAVSSAIATFAAELGEAAMVREMMFRRDRVDIKWADPARPTSVRDATFDEKGLRPVSITPGIPGINETSFPLELLRSLDVAAIEDIKEQAVAAIGLADGTVYRMKFWDGSPFWRSRDGGPLIDVRVEAPTGANGYVVFELDGTLIEAVK